MKPILFSTPMVQAILKGDKTQTRRVVKNKWALEALESGMLPSYICHPENTAYHDYGLPGDDLWVRETFSPTINIKPAGYWYKATCDKMAADMITWKPSIFMPRDACRLFLKIKSVRVERLQDISEQDAIAEGIQKIEMKVMTHLTGFVNYLHRDIDDPFAYKNPVFSFQSLWQKINGNWDANPYVWVVEFEKTEKPQ